MSDENVIIQMLRRPMVVGTAIVFLLALFGTWIGIWQLIGIAGIIGGPIAGVQKARHGFFAGFLGAVLAWAIFLNTNLWQSLDIWDIFLQIATGLEGLGFLGILIAILFGGFLGGISGYFGAAILEYFPSLKAIILARMFGLELQPMKDSQTN